MSSEWKYVEASADEALCRVEQFAFTKLCPEGKPIEFRITVREFAKPPDPTMPFFAQADKQVNQKAAPYTPCGWGSTSTTALWECLKAIRKFPYEA